MFSFLRCATVALSYGHSKVASYLQEALRQNEENKEEWIIENFRNTEWMENSKHLFICSKPFFVTTARYACTWKIYLNCVFCQVWPLPALRKVFRDKSVFIFILDTRCAVHFSVISASGTNHMGREHASREKKLSMVNFLFLCRKMCLQLDSKRSKSAH